MKVENSKNLGFGLGIFRFKLDAFHKLPPQEQGKFVGLLTGTNKADIFEKTAQPQLKVLGESTDNLRRIVIVNASKNTAGIEIKGDTAIEETVVNGAKGILNGGTLQAEIIPNLRKNFGKILETSSKFYNDMSFN